MQAYKGMRPHNNVIGHIESGRKYSFSEKSETMFKVKLVNYIVVEMAVSGDLFETLMAK